MTIQSQLLPCLATLLTISCVGSLEPDGQAPVIGEGESAMTKRTIEEVQNANTPQWMSIPGVVGTAIGECDGKPCIKVLVINKESVSGKIPAQAEGYPVVIQETGEIRALDAEEQSG